ncbi:hypothetical protein KAU15_02980, partial [candidate division WOR-3 bacterium]|nr:hypothetical protein [candidate division WOR-3 bacterium]
MKKIVLIIILIILFGLSVYSQEENIEIDYNPLNFSNEDTTLLWYKNIEFTLGYNLGFCCRGSQLNNSPSDMSLDIIRLISGVTYWLNSVESGIRFPINNRVFEIGLGYGWANIESGAFEVHYPDSIINGTLTNCVDLIFYNTNKYYIFTGYLISKDLIFGLELNYSRGYGKECCCYNSTSAFDYYNVKRDLLGGGIYFKLCNTKKNFKKIRFDPYLMFKIAGSYE